REPALGRCSFGAGTSGCISNAEIREWAKRTGLYTIVRANGDAVAGQIATCADLDDGHILRGDGDDPTAPSLWFPVSVLIDEDGKPRACMERILNPEPATMLVAQ
ncbi:MAG: hypothetical protein AAGO57_10110, partial [Pseudomonadota bacterium]